MEAIKAGELGRSHRCSYNRSKKLILESDKNTNFEKSVIIKDSVKKLLFINRTREISTTWLLKSVLI